MVRKRRTETSRAADKSESQEPNGSAGRGGLQHPVERASMPHQQGGGRRGHGQGLANLQQSQQGGRGGGFYQSHGCRPQYHGVAHHQASPSEHRGRGGPQTRAPQQHFGGRRGGGSIISGHGSALAAGPSRPTLPELHQETQAPHQATQPSLPEASSSSQLLDVSPAQVAQQFEHLAVQGQASSSQAIRPAASSSKSMRFPLCPGKGSFGVKCVVKANHFFAELPDKDLHQYDVSITPEVTSRGVNRAVMGELVRLHRESHLGGRLPAYDGRKSLYTAGPLPFTSRNFDINLYDEENGLGGQRRERLFKVVIKFAARADLHHLELFLSGR